MKKLIFLFILFCGFIYAQPEATIVKKGKTELLQFRSKTFNKSIQLKKLDFYDEDTTDENFTVINHKNIKGVTKVLLEFNYPSNSKNTAGYCGAGTEYGFIILHFDKNYKIIYKNRVLIESCFNNFEYERIIKTEFLEKYKVTGTKETFIATIDKKLVQINIKNE